MLFSQDSVVFCVHSSEEEMERNMSTTKKRSSTFLIGGSKSYKL